MLFIVASRKFPPTNEPLRGTNVTLYSTQRAILLATETIGERFCCCQEEKSLHHKLQVFRMPPKTKLGGSHGAGGRGLSRASMKPLTLRGTYRQYKLPAHPLRKESARQDIVYHRNKLISAVPFIYLFQSPLLMVCFVISGRYSGRHHGSEKFIASLTVEVPRNCGATGMALGASI